jgi:hypothetical protein
LLDGSSVIRTDPKSAAEQVSEEIPAARRHDCRMGDSLVIVS